VIIHEGVAELAGEPQLTADRLSDRPIQALDVSDDLLLLRVPRHPPPTRGAEQYWLYTRSEDRLRLLLSVTLVKPRRGPFLSTGGAAGSRLTRCWRPTSGKRYGESSATRRSGGLRRRLVTEDRLLDPSPEIWSACSVSTGVDYQAHERGSREERAATYQRRYDSAPSHHPPSIYWNADVGIQLIYARRDDSTESRPPQD
jgi:hypothetical protein